MKKTLAILTYAFLIILGIYGLTVDLSARFGAGLGYGLSIDAAILICWLSLFYFFYDKLNLNLETYVFLLVGLYAHIAGDLWFYGLTFGFVQFDMILHAYWGFALALLFNRFLLKQGLKENTIPLFLLTVFGVLGISGLHEILEFLGYSFLGEGPGLLMYGIGDFGEYNDIIWDLNSNFIGALTALAYVKIRK